MSRRLLQLLQARRHTVAGTKIQDGAGFGIVEAVIGMVILTAIFGGLAILITNQWSTSRNVDVLDLVENAVARDLGWSKTYAKQWRMTVGPYNITCTQAGFGASCTPFEVSTASTEYNPDPTGSLCPSPTTADTALAQEFLTAAASVTLAPPRPYPLAVGDTILLNSNTEKRLPAGTTLVRKITLGRNLLLFSYSFTGVNAASYRFLREAAVMPEAASWC